MNNDKLDALGDALGVGDDTRDVERPTAGRGLASVLGSKLIEDDEEDTEEGAKLDAIDGPVSAPVDVKPKPAASRSAGGRKSGSRATSRVADSEPKASRRSTATVPIDVVVRLREAKQKRWDLGRLLQDALALCEAGDLTESAAESFLERSSDEPRSTESFQLPVDDLEAIDAIGHRWRINRSQLISVMLDRQLTDLGF